MEVQSCHCGEPAVGVCAWPCEKWVPTLVHDLRHGDLCRNIAGTRTGRILRIETILAPNPNLLKFTVQRYSRSRPSIPSRIDQYEWDLRAHVARLGTGPCGAHVCFRHIRDLDGEHYICSEHWAAQLEAIA